MVADGGKLGSGRFAVDWEVMIWPLGTMMLTEGFEVEVGWWSKRCETSWKLADAPLSTFISNNGGADIEFHKFVSLELTVLKGSCDSMLPLFQLQGLHRSVVPFILFWRVASAWWPSFWRLQDLLL
jgi:hypothetical protein